MARIRVKLDRPTPLPPTVYHGRSQQVKPLTHHEILSLIGPFATRGRRADLRASDRPERKLAFMPIAHPSGADGGPALTEDLVLEVQQKSRFCLQRTVTIASGHGAGLASRLTADGNDLERLLDRLEAIPVRRQVEIYSGVPLVRGYHLDVGATVSGDGSAPAPAFVDARARIDGVNLDFQADRKRGMPMEVKLTVDPGQELHLPEDLLAVIGWSWRPLVHIVSYWRGTVNVSRREPKRTPDIEAKLGRTIRHLVRTFDGPPEDFHRRHRRARWRVTLQRAVPLLIGLALLAATPAIRFLELDDNSILRMLIFHAPPLLLFSFFLMREMPRFEIPPVPRPLRNRSWIVSTAEIAQEGNAWAAGADGETRVEPLKADS